MNNSTELSGVESARNVTGSAAVTLGNGATVPCYAVSERDALGEWVRYLDGMLAKMFRRKYGRSAANDDELIDYYIAISNGILDESQDKERLREKTQQARRWD